MAKPKSIRLEKAHREAIKDMVDRGKVDNASEAHKQFLSEGMRQFGYEYGEYADTRLQAVAGEFARAFAWIGVGWLALTLLLPVGFRLGSVGAFSASLACVVIYRVLEQHEPNVSRRLSGLFRGERA